MLTRNPAGNQKMMSNKKKRLENQPKESAKIMSDDKLNFYLTDKKVLDKVVQGLIADLEMLK